ncbi:RNA polymerase sigma factor, sigma-70 family [Verrucomicrobiia bacterium DG1235]|nr:RNA polymerase sigma factor, sigma-70 family [Verrucomicrobiae bacterium DG1235]
MPVFRLKKPSSPEPPAIETLFAELEAPLLAYAYRITAQLETAQDIVQDAFVKLHQSSAPVHSPKPWLYRTVHNLAINLSKRRSRETPFDPANNTNTPPETSSSTQSSAPSKALEQAEIQGLTRLLIEQLDPRSRAVVQLKFHDGLSYAQIGEKLGLTPSNVGYILHQAVSSLASEFKKLGLRK